MCNAINEQKIERLYAYFYEHIRPLQAALEIETSREYLELQNEVRAAFDHIARVYLDSKEDIENKENKDKRELEDEHNIRCAQGHLNRVELDILKHLILCFHKKCDAFRDSIKSLDLSRVDKGRFVSEILETPFLVYLYECKAREEESKDKEEALKLYRTAYVVGNDFFEKVSTHKSDIKNAKTKYYRHIVLKILGIISTSFIIYEFQAIVRFFFQ